MTGTVIITDGEQRAALATVRSLGRAGFRVVVCASSKHSISGSSRFSARQEIIADPLREPGKFLSALRRVVDSERADVLIPVTEAALLAVLPQRTVFDCVIPFAPADSFARICDKREVLNAAQKLGVATPYQTELASAADSATLHSWPKFPIVLKPYRSVAGKPGERVRGTVAYANDREELESVLNAIPAAAYPVLAQHRIDGPGFGISILFWDGEVKAAFAHRRIREKPPSGGVSVLRESIPLDPVLLARSAGLLTAFGWQGVAMVEFKLEETSGVPYLMEINGRLWGSLQLAIDSGVDFPDLLVRAALGEKLAPTTSYQLGVRCRWEWGDVDHLLATVFHSNRRLVLPHGRRRRHRLHSLTAFFRDLVSNNHAEVFRRDDPRPFFRESVNWFRDL